MDKCNADVSKKSKHKKTGMGILKLSTTNNNIVAIFIFFLFRAIHLVKIFNKYKMKNKRYFILKRFLYN